MGVRTTKTYVCDLCGREEADPDMSGWHEFRPGRYIGDFVESGALLICDQTHVVTFIDGSWSFHQGFVADEFLRSVFPREPVKGQVAQSVELD